MSGNNADAIAALKPVTQMSLIRTAIRIGIYTLLRYLAVLLISRLAISLAVMATVILTVVLISVGALGNAAQVTAYATVVLATGTVGLAAGAIGTYLAQRETNQQQAEQLTAAEVADMAQVMIHRNSGPGEYLAVTLTNGSRRAIRQIYVWADVNGITGRYHGCVQGPAGEFGRGMRNVPRGQNLYLQYRAILPGEGAVFEQRRDMSADEPVNSAVADSDITVYAEFMAASGKWWRIDEEGNVNQLGADLRTGPVITDQRRRPRGTREE